MRFILLLLALVLGIFNAHGQMYRMKKFHEKQGLPNRFVTALEQDSHGYLWIGTGEGIFNFDGFNFNSAFEDQLQFAVSTSYAQEDGTIWFGLGDGRLYKVVSQQCTQVEFGLEKPSKINQIVEFGNEIWILTQDQGIHRINTQGSFQHFTSGLEEFILYSIAPLAADKALVGTDMGLIEVSIPSNGPMTYAWNAIITETKVSTLKSIGDQVIVGTEDQGIYTIRKSDGNISQVLVNDKDLSRYQINHLFLQSDSHWQIATNNAGLIGIQHHEHNQSYSVHSYCQADDISFRSIKTSFIDRENNIWLGTIGEGLAMLLDNAVSMHPLDKSQYSNNCLAVSSKGNQIFRGDFNKVLICQDNPTNIISTIDLGIPENANTITALYVDNNNVLWIGTQSNGLWTYEISTGKKKKFHLSEDILNNQINDLTGFDNHLYVATEYGIFHIHENILLKNAISMQSGLAHNAVRSMFRDSQGRIWLASTHNQVTFIADGVIQNIETPFNGALIEITCFAEDQQKNIWAGTDGNGIFQLTSHDQKKFDSSHGLRSDHVYGMAVDPYNRLWVTHRGAITRVDVAKNSIRIIEPEDEDVLFAYNAIDMSTNGIFYFGSDHGILEYDYNKDSDVHVEPLLQMRKLYINDSLYLADSVVLNNGTYQVHLEVIAISLQNPEGVLYQYYLEGYDNEWSKPSTSRHIVYNKLEDGQYVLRVRAYNSEGFGGSTELSVKITIAIPIWKTWWFIILVIAGLIGIILLVIFSRERSLRQNQLNLQRALDERTKEVMKQKELLEISNKDITDSIKYAKNIQQAMLPSHEVLNDYFTDTFIYFKPRDIVSGDFYTIEKFNDIVVVSCADCTGHGVPGAFMSLIGSTILKEVTTDKSVQNASAVLVKLDGRLREMLNKQGTTSVSDGMDISIFDYNTTTRRLRLASANRSTFLHHKGEWIEIKGDRRNVGGSEIANISDYTMHEFDIEPGDSIYLFSDGITDQFGGEFGKKIKKSGLLDWIKSIHQLPMQDQRNFIKNQFKTWKNRHEQTDDVILIGIRF
jgi:ligand-binding sensor domain-containing protein/serine phosphatase RsbU (regulator of sigma subunit)